MAYLVRRPSGTFQIRESVRLRKRGPRSRVLSSFKGALNDRVLSRAEQKSTRPLDRENLIAQARRLGIGWESSIQVAARSLVMSLRRGRTLDPILVGLLQANLAELPSAVLDDELREAADWLGRSDDSDEERGAALCGLLRLSDAIVQSRGTPDPTRPGTGPNPEFARVGNPLVADLLEKVIAISKGFDQAEIPHSFGGAIALAYYAVPRGTESIDLNLFVEPGEAARPLSVLRPLGISDAAIGPVEDKGRLTLKWDHTPIHVFLSYDPFHESCRIRARSVPFSNGSISILSGEDIAIFKTILDSAKDRSGVREILLCMGERLDTEYILGWLTKLLGDRDARTEGFRAAVAGVIGT